VCIHVYTHAYVWRLCISSCMCTCVFCIVVYRTDAQCKRLFCFTVHSSVQFAMQQESAWSVHINTIKFWPLKLNLSILDFVNLKTCGLLGAH